MGHRREYQVVFRTVLCLNLLIVWMLVSLRKMEDNRPNDCRKSKFSCKHLELVAPVTHLLRYIKEIRAEVQI